MLVLQAFKDAIPSTWKSASWLLQLMIPISLAVTLLKYFGVLAWLAQYLNPLFVHLGLPGSSAVIFISGAAAGTYAGLAAMMSVELTLREATILGIMIALCHALPMECTVNKKTGSSFWGMAVIRLIAAFLCAYLLNMWLGPNDTPYIYVGASADSTLSEVIYTWIWSQVKMAAMVFAIIYLLMVVQKLIEMFHLMQKLTRLFAPLMTQFGLPQNVAYMWLVGNVLGLSYGSAVMLELEEKGMISREEADAVNYHLIMNHSLLEDTIVLASTGIPALLLVAVRIGFATFIVWLRRGFQTLFNQ